MADMKGQMRPPMQPGMQGQMRPPMPGMQGQMRPPMPGMQGQMRPPMPGMQGQMRPPMMQMMQMMPPPQVQLDHAMPDLPPIPAATLNTRPNEVWTEPEFTCCESICCAITGCMTGLCFCGNFQQIQDYERGIVLRHGKRLQKEALAGGMHYIIPGVDDLMKVDIRERPLDVPRQGVLTREGTLLQIDGVVHFKIFDADKALLTTQDYRTSIKLITITKLREILALYTFEQIQQERQRIAGSLKAILDEASAPWGVDITRVELTEIILPPSLQNAMNAQKTAERTAVSQMVEAKSRAEVAMVDAKGASGAMTVSAEAIAKAKLIEAQGEKAAAEDFKSAADIMSANPVSLSVQYLQTLQNLGATGTNNTVVLPFDTDNYSILSKDHQKSQKASRA